MHTPRSITTLRYCGWGLQGLLVIIGAWLLFALWPPWLTNAIGIKSIFVNTILNGVTLGGLYFLVASGFTLIFGLMHNINLAHGSLYLLGAYVGYEIATATGIWYMGVVGAFLAMAIVGITLQYFVFLRMPNQELRHTLITIGISIVLADLMLAVWTGTTYQFSPPEWLFGTTLLPIVTTISETGESVFLKYPVYRLAVLVVAITIGSGLWFFLNRTHIGLMVRAGVDDRAMLSVVGVNVQAVFIMVFAVGAGLAGVAGVIGGTALSIAPGEDVRYLLASLVVVIVGGIGSVAGAALGALIIGVAEQIGLVYFPTYGVIITFVIMVIVLAFRPQGLLGKGK